MTPLTWKFLTGALNPVVDDAVKELMTKQYDDNLALLIPVAKKLTVQAILENDIRAQFGTALRRPLGSPNYLSPWERILLNPRQLFELPAPDFEKIDTTTVIGKKAKKPLKLDIPIMITAMSNGGSLNENMKIALAKGAAMAGTSTNTGESTVVESERKAAKYLIGQYNRGGWLTDPEQLSQLDAIEVQLGQGAYGGAVHDAIKANEVTDYQREIWNIPEGEAAVIHARMPGINSTQDIINLINRLKSEYDVPVGIKIAGSHFIEKELEVISRTNADFITIDGSEGGTASAYVTNQDGVGFPTLFALARAVNLLEDKKLKDKYSLIIAGGLRTPAEFLRALAIGADAVYIGTVAVMTALQTQIVKAVPETVPVQIALYNGKYQDKLNIDEAAINLTNFLKAAVLEMKHATQTTGKTNVHDLSREDLVTMEKTWRNC